MLAVVKLIRSEANGDPITCTGSFISSTRILTAAHCLGNAKTPFLIAAWIIDDDTLIERQARFIAVHPLFETGGKAIQSSDLAILSIDAAQDLVPTPMKLLANPIEIGSEVTLVGYGNNTVTLENGVTTGTGAGVKRVGKNKLYTSTRGGLIIVSGDVGSCGPINGNSVTADGDSGGPLLINDHIAGITLGGGFFPAKDANACPKAISYFANLQLKQNAEFISNSLKEFLQ